MYVAVAAKLERLLRPNNKSPTILDYDLGQQGSTKLLLSGTGSSEASADCVT